MACKKKYADGGIVRRPTPSVATESDPWRDMYAKRFADGGFVNERHNPDNRLPKTARHKGRGNG